MVSSMLSPETLPLYLVLKELPWNSRTTVKEMSSPLTLPSVISTGPPRPPEIEPLSASPEAFRVRVTVCGPLRPCVSYDHLPDGSAAKATTAKRHPTRNE